MNKTMAYIVIIFFAIILLSSTIVAFIPNADGQMLDVNYVVPTMNNEMGMRLQ